jgi:hypothetical protein
MSPKRSKYDDVVQNLRKNLEAGGVLLLVMDGQRGQGLVTSVRADAYGKWRALVPMALRALADDIERGETAPEVHGERVEN